MADPLLRPHEEEETSQFYIPATRTLHDGRLRTLKADDCFALLDRHGVFVRHGHHCTMPLHDLLKVPATTRASFAFYNNREDVDALIEGIHYARKRLRVAD